MSDMAFTSKDDEFFAHGWHAVLDLVEAYQRFKHHPGDEQAKVEFFRESAAANSDPILYVSAATVALAKVTDLLTQNDFDLISFLREATDEPH